MQSNNPHVWQRLNSKVRYIDITLTSSCSMVVVFICLPCFVAVIMIIWGKCDNQWSLCNHGVLIPQTIAPLPVLPLLWNAIMASKCYCTSQHPVWSLFKKKASNWAKTHPMIFFIKKEAFYCFKYSNIQGAFGRQCPITMEPDSLQLDYQPQIWWQASCTVFGIQCSLGW